MASKATPDEIVAFKTAGTSNHDITKQLTVCRKISMYGNDIQRGCYNIQQAYSWSKAFDSYQCNCASGCEAKSLKEHEENGKLARDFKIMYAQDI